MAKIQLSALATALKKMAVVTTYALSELADSVSDALGTKLDKQTYVAIDNSTSSYSTGATLAVGDDYTLSQPLDTYGFTLPNTPTDGEITVHFSTGSQPAVSFYTQAAVYVQDGWETQVNSIYEKNIRAFQGAYYVVLVKMIPYAQA